MNTKSQLPKRQKNQTTIWLDNIDNDLISKPICFEVFSTKRPLKHESEMTSGRCWKFFDEFPCVGAIWYIYNNFEAVAHECVHLAHHIAGLKMIKVSQRMRESYNDNGHWIYSREEKVCQISGILIDKINLQHYLKYNKHV